MTQPTETQAKPKRVYKPRFIKSLVGQRDVLKHLVKAGNALVRGEITVDVHGELRQSFRVASEAIATEVFEQRLEALEARAESRVIPGSATEVRRKPLELVRDA